MADWEDNTESTEPMGEEQKPRPKLMLKCPVCGESLHSDEILDEHRGMVMKVYCPITDDHYCKITPMYEDEQKDPLKNTHVCSREGTYMGHIHNFPELELRALNRKLAEQVEYLTKSNTLSLKHSTKLQEHSDKIAERVDALTNDVKLLNDSYNPRGRVMATNQDGIRDNSIEIGKLGGNHATLLAKIDDINDQILTILRRMNHDPEVNPRPDDPEEDGYTPKRDREVEK